MDKGKLNFLTAQAVALRDGLLATQDSNQKASQRCHQLADQVDGFTKVWSNLSTALGDRQVRPRAGFTQLLNHILSDNNEILRDLRDQLSTVKSRSAQTESNSRSKKWMSRPKSGHVLVTLFGCLTVPLRQLQIMYAISVLDVILGVTLYTKTIGQEQPSQDDAHASLRDQLTRLYAENKAKAAVFVEERRIGEKAIMTHQWFSNVDWYKDSAEVCPFETLALQWFLLAPEQDLDLRETNSMEFDDLVRTVKQIQQESRERNGKYEDQLRGLEQRAAKERDWARRTIEQLELSNQRAAQDAASKIEELRSQMEVQRQKIESDTVLIEHLKSSRGSWSAHYQKQVEKFQDLEEQMQQLRNSHTQQKGRLDVLQEENSKLRQAYAAVHRQNQALRKKLEESEAEKHGLEDRVSQLGTEHSKAVKRAHQWHNLYKNALKDPNAELERLSQQLQKYKEDLAQVKSDLDGMTGQNVQLRSSLSEAEEQLRTERRKARRRLRSDASVDNEVLPDQVEPVPPTMPKRRTSKTAEPSNTSQRTRRDCPNAYDNRLSGTPGRSRRRSDSPSARGSSKASTSRASSATYVNDNENDFQAGRRVSSDASSSKMSFFSGWTK